MTAHTHAALHMEAQRLPKMAILHQTCTGSGFEGEGRGDEFFFFLRGVLPPSSWGSERKSAQVVEFFLNIRREKGSDVEKSWVEIFSLFECSKSNTRQGQFGPGERSAAGRVQ